jgi:hypothetical protein
MFSFRQHPIAYRATHSSIHETGARGQQRTRSLHAAMTGIAMFPLKATIDRISLAAISNPLLVQTNQASVVLL